MSLNKFSNEDTGFDLKLNLGCDTLKCNSLNVLTEATIPNVPITTLVNGDGPVPVFTTGSGTLESNDSIYKTELVGISRYATLSGSLKYSSIVGALAGSNNILEFEITPPDAISYPFDNEFLPGSLNVCINDLTPAGTGLYATSAIATSSVGKIIIRVYVIGDITGLVPLRNLWVNYHFKYLSAIF